MRNSIKNKLKKALIIGGLSLAGASFYSGERFEKLFNSGEVQENSPQIEYMKLISENYFENPGKYTTFQKAKEGYEAYKKSELEKIVMEEKKAREYSEKKKFLEAYYLSQDSLSIVIKQAYNNVKKWPKEFDKRLFRLMLKQESQYDAHAISKTGYMGLGQVGAEVYETFRPEKFATFKDTITGQFDEHALQKELFNPITNLELSLQYLDYISKFCARYDSNWEKSDLDTKRKKILFAYNAGVGTARDYEFDPNTKFNSKNEKLKELPKENREHADKIMDAYYDSNIKIKI
jgi:soluble lytic murein transglycosylase-like protein